MTDFVEQSNSRPLLSIVTAKGGSLQARMEAARLLTAIDEAGSISGAARLLKLSYKHVWDTLTSLEQSSGLRLIERQVGGLRGGGCALTEQGKELLHRLERIHDAVISQPPLLIVGSDCPGLEILVSLLRETVGTRLVSAGTFAGIAAIKRKQADIAGIHIHDGDTGSYVSILRKYRLHKDAVVMAGYVRTQGLIVGKGNAKGIRSIEDIMRMDVKFVNRNQGSGTRSLTESLLKEVAEKRGTTLDALTKMIRGFADEAASHDEVAARIGQGEADVGVGLRTVSAKYGLDFVSPIEENYDFLIRRESLESGAVEPFQQVLSGQDFFRHVTSKLVGIVPTKKSGRIIAP